MKSGREEQAKHSGDEERPCIYSSPPLLADVGGRLALSAPEIRHACQGHSVAMIVVPPTSLQPMARHRSVGFGLNAQIGQYERAYPLAASAPDFPRPLDRFLAV